jgi:hypothetical protein
MYGHSWYELMRASTSVPHAVGARTPSDERIHRLDEAEPTKGVKDRAPWREKFRVRRLVG